MTFPGMRAAPLIIVQWFVILVTSGTSWLCPIFDLKQTHPDKEKWNVLDMYFYDKSNCNLFLFILLHSL